MGCCWAKDAVDYALSQVGYECDKNKWNIYAEQLDAVDYFTGCGKKQNLDFCAVGVNACIFNAIKYPDCNEDAESAKWAAHYFLYQSDSCDTAAVVKYLYAFFPDDAITDNPERGDIAIFQKSNGVMYHCGIVTGWDNDYIYITEFNTEGGKVKTHSYKYSDIGNKIKCFCRPRYDGWEENGSNGNETEKPEQPGDSSIDLDALIDKLARDCIEGYYGNGIERKNKINSLGYGNIYSKVQNRVNMILYR